MNHDCPSIRECLAPYLEGELVATEAAPIADHLAGCDTCRELAELMTSLRTLGAAAGAALVPPARLRDRLGGSPCGRWQSLMFRAIDHELPAEALGRLVDHLEACPTCHRSWDDLTLIHQVGAALVPRAGLVAACSMVRRRPPRRRKVLGRRSAVAAAYVLAVLTSLAIGNPVTTARMPGPATVQKMAAGLGADFVEVAADSRGELRVMLWRAGRWAERRVAAVRQLLGVDDPASDHDDTSLGDDFVELKQGE